MGRIYVAGFDSVAVTALQDLISIKTDDDKCVIVHEVRITQSSEIADAQSEQLAFDIKLGVGNTAGSGGAAANAVPLDVGDAADSATVRVNDTTRAVAGGGSITQYLTVDEHVQAGWHYLPTPETRIAITGGDTIIFGLAANPADSVTFDGYVIFEELG